MFKKFISLLAISLTFFTLTVLPVYAQTGLQNPLSVKTIADFVAAALRVMVMVALPIVTLFLVVSGFLFITAQGKEAELTKAKKNFYYVIIGTLLILGAWVIATLIAGTVSQLTGTT